MLTEKGRGLFPVIVGLRQWGEDHYYGPREAHSELIDRKRGQPVRRLEIHAQDGRRLEPDDTSCARWRRTEAARRAPASNSPPLQRRRPLPRCQ